MAPNEQEIKKRLCPRCSVALLHEHPEEKFQRQGYKKCVLCGYTEKQEIKTKSWTKIKKSQ